MGTPASPAPTTWLGPDAPPGRSVVARRAALAGAHRMPHWRRLGTAGRLAALHAVILVVVLGGVVAAVVRSYTLSYQALAAQSLTAESRSFQRAAADRPAGQDTLAFAEAYLRAHAEPAGHAVIVSVTGQGTVASAGTAPLLADPAVRARLGSRLTASAVGTVSLDGTPTELAVVPILSGSRQVGVFLATADLSTFAESGSHVLAVALVGAFVALVTGVVSGYLLLRRLLRRVGDVTSTAEEIRRGDLRRRLGDQGTNDEVGALARSFDALLDHLDTSVTAQRRLLSDVSHQLRTPLTVARGHLEVLERTELGNPDATRDAVELVVDEIDHMRTLVDRLLLLGRAMEGGAARREPVDLRALVGDVFDASRVIADRDWRIREVPDVVLTGDPVMLRGALLNLVDNAVRATGEGDAIELGAELTGSGQIAIVIEDSGPGIPAEQRLAVLNRFARPGARGAGGTGLGLAIVKAVAEAQGGELQVGESELGGARVVMLLPVPGSAWAG